MSKATSISRNNAGLPDWLDFRRLRDEGLTHLGQFSGDLWTDHNTHDPGITVLEALIFALLDLGYRSSDDIRNILAPNPAAGPEAAAARFFTAKEILGCNPVTVADWRKVLLDIPGVRNAWLEPMTNSEPPLYVSCDPKPDGSLTYTAPPVLKAGTHDQLLKKCLPLNGLWRVWLQPEAVRPQDSASGCDPEGNSPLNRILDDARSRLNALRNLCEDFVEIRLLQEEQIGLCASIEIDPTLEPEAVLTEMLVRLEAFLSPVIPFYSLQELLEKGRSTEEIFEGRPLLDSKSHGFIDAIDLEREQPTVLHLSDLYHVMLETPGVRAVRDLRASSYVDGQPRIKNERWQLPLSVGFFPVLAPTLGQFALLKDGIPQGFDLKKATDRFLARLTSAEKTLRKPWELDQLPPEGEFRAGLGEHFSIQNDFPLVYGIGPGGLAPADPLKPDQMDSRRAQALQLKGYLLFFDQLLANYMAQLGTARDAFLLRKTSAPLPDPSALRVASIKESVPRFADLVMGADPQPGGDPITGSERRYRVGDPVMFPLKPGATGDAAFPNHRHFGSPEDRDLVLRRLVEALEGNQFDIQFHETANHCLLFELRFHFAMPGNEDALTLRGLVDFLEEKKARLEAESLAFLGLQPENFQKIDRQDEGRYSFSLAYQPRDYGSFLKQIDAPGHAARDRRDRMLNHLLARFGEDFSEYALFAYAASNGADVADSLIAVEENFLGKYPEISRNRGRGFDYSLKNELWDTPNVTGLEARAAALMGIADASRHTLAPFSMPLKPKTGRAQWLDWCGQPMLVSTDNCLTEPTDDELADLFIKWKEAIGQPGGLRPTACSDWGIYSFELVEKPGTDDECILAKSPQDFGSKALRDSKMAQIAAIFANDGWNVKYPLTPEGWVFKLLSPTGEALLQSAVPVPEEDAARLQWIAARNRAADPANYRFVQDPLGNGWSFHLTDTFGGPLAVAPKQFFDKKEDAEKAAAAIAALFPALPLEAAVEQRPAVHKWELTDGEGHVVLESLHQFETAEQASAALCEALELARDTANLAPADEPVTGDPTFFLQKTWPAEPGDHPAYLQYLAGPLEPFADAAARDAAIAQVVQIAIAETSLAGKIRVKANALRPVLASPDGKPLLDGLEIFSDWASLEAVWPAFLARAANAKNYASREVDGGLELALLDEKGHDLALAPCLFASKTEVDDHLAAIDNALFLKKPAPKTTPVDEAWAWLLAGPDGLAAIEGDRWFESQKEAKAARLLALSLAGKKGGLDLLDGPGGICKIQLLDATGCRLGASPGNFKSAIERKARLDDIVCWFEGPSIRPHIADCPGAWFFEVKKDGCVVLQSPEDFDLKIDALLALDKALDAAACSTDNFDFYKSEDGCLFSFDVSTDGDTLAEHPIFYGSTTEAEQVAADLAACLCPWKMPVVFEKQAAAFHWELCMEVCCGMLEVMVVGTESFGSEGEAEDDFRKYFTEKDFKLALFGPVFDPKLPPPPPPYTFHLETKDAKPKIVAVHPRLYQTQADYEEAKKAFDDFIEWHNNQWHKLIFSAPLGNATAHLFHLDKPEAVGVFQKQFATKAASEAAMADWMHRLNCRPPAFSTLDFDASVVKKKPSSGWIYQLKTGQKVWWESAKSFATAAEALAAFEQDWPKIIALAAAGFYETDCSGDMPCYFWLPDGKGGKLAKSPDLVPNPDGEAEFDEHLKMAQTYPVIISDEKFCWQLFDFGKQERVFLSAKSWATAAEALAGFDRFLELTRHCENFAQSGKPTAGRFSFEVQEATLDAAFFNDGPDQTASAKVDAGWERLDFVLSNYGQSVRFEQALEPGAGCRFELFLATEAWRVARHCRFFHSPAAREAARDALFQKMKCMGTCTAPKIENGCFFDTAELCKTWDLSSLDLPGNANFQKIKTAIADHERIEAAAVVDLMALARSADFYIKIGEPKDKLRLGLLDEKNRVVLVGAKLLDGETDWEKARDDAIDQAWAWMPIVRRPGDGFGFQLATKEASGWEILFESSREFGSVAEAVEAFERFCKLIEQKENFGRTETSDCGPFGIEITDPEAVVARHPATYELRSEWAAARDRLEKCLDAEGFHLAEHILLRPRELGDPLLPICLPEGTDCASLDFTGKDKCLPGADPYSFWATAVIPYWSRRFRSLPFRQFFEKTLRQEAPAHVALRIAWLDARGMADFEKNWRAFLESTADGDGSCSREAALAALFGSLASMRNRYPTISKLFGSGAGEGQVILLDQTNLA